MYFQGHPNAAQADALWILENILDENNTYCHSSTGHRRCREHYSSGGERRTWKWSCRQGRGGGRVEERWGNPTQIVQQFQEEDSKEDDLQRVDLHPSQIDQDAEFPQLESLIDRFIRVCKNIM